MTTSKTIAGLIGPDAVWRSVHPRSLGLIHRICESPIGAARTWLLLISRFGCAWMDSSWS
jgi:hypothetical protein